MSSNASDSDSDLDAVVIDRDDISNYNPEQILPETPETIQAIRSWLEPTSYDIAGGEYRKHLASHVAGTGAWLTSTDTYQQWLQSEEHGLLWIKGIPGSGKSVMAANLIHEIADANPGCPVLFFFFRQIIEANHEPEALLRDWMDQVLDYSPPLQKQLKTYVKARRSIDSVSMEDMWKHLKMAFAGLPGRVFCVADALDEMDRGHDAFLQALGALGQWRPGKVKVLMTSRPVPSVEVPLRKIPCLHLRLQESLVDLDISTYVQFALSQSAIPKSNWQVIADAVPGRANGLFLYAKLAMDAFLEPGVDITQVLSHLPADLNVLYTDLLKEHAQRSGVAADIQHLILQSVTHATRPLRLLELAEMIKVNSPDGSTRDLKATKDLIRAACGPLLEILADETVSVIHHSFTEYLKGTTRSNDSTGYPILRMGPTHAQLAMACLHYLQAGCLDMVDVNIDGDDGGYNSDYDDYDFRNRDLPHLEIQLRLKHPFFEYAASNWHHHVKRSDVAGHDQTELNSEIAKFLGDDKNRKSWLQIKWPGREAGAPRVAQLHIAARSGLASYAKELLKDVEVDARDGRGQTPLWWAASKGQAAVMRQLIAAGANPNADDVTHGLTPLHQAANKNHHEAVKVLLEAGVNPLTPKMRNDPGGWCGNAPTSRGHTPLMYACHNGHLETVQEFLPFLKDIDIVHRALAWAAGSGQSKVVARILQHPGVDVNAKVRGDTPLFLACGGSNIATIELLLGAGADATIACERNDDEFAGIGSFRCYPLDTEEYPTMNCLHQICGWGSNSYRSESDDEDVQRVFAMLVEAGVDVHGRTRSGATALHLAVGSPVLTKLLLDAGLDVNATDGSGCTPLHKVESVDTMAVLIEQGHANLDVKQADGKTPLLCMLNTYHENVILKFLEYGPDCNVLDNEGNGPLHISLRQWSSKPDIVKALLKGGSDPNLKNRDGLTPMHSLRLDNREASGMMDLLLEAGADIDAVNRDGATPLLCLFGSSSYRSLSEDHEDVKELLDRGASISVRDFDGRTCLHEAVRVYDETQLFGRNPNNTKFHFLIRQGLDIKSVDYRGNGLLHEYALRRDNHESYHGPKMVPSWEELVDLGLDLEQKNYAGRTPLHILCGAHTHLILCQQGDVMPIDWVIPRTKNLDVADRDGITPLHIAATCGEAYTKKLLDAGADPTVITHEGLTPLHLASRCRQSNVVGLLLDALRKRQGLSDTRSLPVKGVDAKAFLKGYGTDHLTPLAYAVRSGRPETVAILLEAGADAKLGNLFNVLLSFEEEDALWVKPWLPTEDGQRLGDPVALKIYDTSRRAKYESYRSDNEPKVNETTRLEEIVELLIKHGLDIAERRNSSGIKLADRSSRDYTASCLRHALEKKRGDGETEIPEGALTTVYDLMHQSRRDASMQTFKNYEGFKAGDDNQELFCYLLVRKEYRLVEELARLGVDFLPGALRDRLSNLGILIQHGFTSLVEKIGTLAAEAKLETGDWHAFGDQTRPGLWFAKRDLSKPDHKGANPAPFLLEALGRDLPNMDMVRLLVEKFGVDINEVKYSHQYHEDSYKTLPSESALSWVSRGFTWWNVYHALPYLLNAGADMNMRNRHGQTPLHVALQGDEYYSGCYHREAAKMLIEAGADVDAVNNKGESCLACAQHDVEMIRLLKAHGATVTADSILGAIDAKNAEALRELLAGGIDANMRREKVAEDPAKEKERKKLLCTAMSAMKGIGLEHHQEYPLYHAGKAASLSCNPTPKERRENKMAMEVVRVLLENGADPFAKFWKEEDDAPPSHIVGDPVIATPSIEVPEGLQECTILHELVSEGALVDDFLRLPGLDVNHRDAKGRTLLHVACRRSTGPDYILGSHKDDKGENETTTLFQQLLSLGAELEARDNFGWNVLHWMLGTGQDWLNIQNTFAYVLKKAPALVNQADAMGRTPLHYAVARAASKRDPGVAEDLLAAGADPLAVDKNGDGVLHKLAKNLDAKALRAFFQDLMRRGADVNSRNALGETPLFAFCKRPKKVRSPYQDHDNDPNKEKFTEEGVELQLKEWGADFLARDNKGRGLLHVAGAGDVDVFKNLMALGLDVMLEDEAQQTPIDVAAACANEDVLELFEKK
ncbi:putative ankyrin repeat protein, partial [Thelonectria olida]